MAGVLQIISRFERKPKSLIPVLQAIQEQHGHISAEAADEVAEELRVSRGEVYGVASFYDQFVFEPPAQHTVLVCMGTSCHSAGAPAVLAALEGELGISCEELSDDGTVFLGRGKCPGVCARAPVVTVDGRVLVDVTPQSAVEAVRALRKAGGGN